MKTTLEIPDFIFRRAKSAAAERGIPLWEFVTEAVKDKLVAGAKTREKPWMAGFGKLRHLFTKKRRKLTASLSKNSSRSMPRTACDLGHERIIRRD
jgi:hypothetical protein